MTVEIDEQSGFCFGVVTAISKAEEVIKADGHLYCLGDIVHNAREMERLCRKGLDTITHGQLKELRDVKVLLRAHGEPPATYRQAQRNGIEIVDATCPVVLQLQRRIKAAYDAGKRKKEAGGEAPQIVIFGKRGHAEVNGLVGQTQGEAIVVQNIEELNHVNPDLPVILYSQTTMSITGFEQMVEALQMRQKAGFEYFDTICRQVSRRMESMMEFAKTHDVVLFVTGAKSSNGKALYEQCKSENPRTYMVADAADVPHDKIMEHDFVGITGATSTPRWLMEEVRSALLKI